MPILPEKLKLSPQMMRALPLLLLLFVAFILATGLFNPDEEVRKSRVIGNTIRNLDLPLLGENGRFTPALWKNKVVILNFFASWCETCEAEHPTLLQLTQSGKVEMLGIAWKDKPEETVAWLQEHGSPYHHIGSDEDGDTTLSFGLSGVPETFIIAPDGKIAYNYKAPINDELVNTVILPLVEHLQKNNAPAPANP